MSEKDQASLVVHVVDDSEPDREYIQIRLQKAGFQVKLYPGPHFFLSNFTASPLGVLLLDYQMPEMDGLTLLKRVKLGGLRMPVVVMSGYGTFEIAAEFMHFGIEDCIEKPLCQEELLSVVQKASDTAHQRQKAYLAAKRRDRLLSGLTRRQRELFEAVARGRTNKQISDDLNIALRTVEHHRQHMMEKLGAHCLSDIIEISRTEQGADK